MVRGIPHQRLHIYKLIDIHTVFFKKCRLVRFDRVMIGGKQHMDTRGDQLQRIPVTGQQIDKTIRVFLGQRGNRPQNVIRLIAFAVHPAKSKRLCQFPGNRHLSAQFLGHLVSARFIVRVHFMAECGRFQIVCDHSGIRIDHIQLFSDHCHRAEQRIGGKAVPVGQRSDSVKRTVQDAVAVNCKYLFHFSASVFFYG
ncbi:unknown [Clostridium sp. CAG:448]|nr:unknown [Clostridium sp. CAG:448]